MKKNSLVNFDGSWLLESIWLMQKGHVFFIGRSWENMFLKHGSKSALFISIHSILSQQGQQEIFSLKASVFHWSFFKNIYNCSIKITIAEYESWEKCVITMCPPICTSWSPLKSVVFLTLGVFERKGSMLFFLNSCAILWHRFDGGVFWWKRAEVFL